MENLSRGIGVKAAQQLRQREEMGEGAMSDCAPQALRQMSVQEVLIDRAQQLKSEAEGLLRLASALPAGLENLDHAAARALLKLLNDRR